MSLMARLQFLRFGKALWKALARPPTRRSADQAMPVMLVSGPYSIVDPRSASVQLRIGICGSAAYNLLFEACPCQIQMTKGPSCVGFASAARRPQAPPNCGQEDRVDPDWSLWSFLCSAFPCDVFSLGHNRSADQPMAWLIPLPRRPSMVGTKRPRSGLKGMSQG
jgi:hypothetical protein